MGDQHHFYSFHLLGKIRFLFLISKKKKKSCNPHYNSLTTLKIKANILKQQVQEFQDKQHIKARQKVNWLQSSFPVSVNRTTQMPHETITSNKHTNTKVSKKNQEKKIEMTSVIECKLFTFSAVAT